MADILLQKPAEGQVTALTPQAEDRLVFEFDPSEALLERQGENLVLSFEDGSVIELTDFYIAYTSENMPEFVIGEAIVPGEAFFAALGEELMPAAGNEGSSPDGSGTGVGVDDPSLLGGIGRELRLDQEYPDDDDNDDNREGDGTQGTDGTDGTDSGLGSLGGVGGAGGGTEGGGTTPGGGGDGGTGGGTEGGGETGGGDGGGTTPGGGGEGGTGGETGGGDGDGGTGGTDTPISFTDDTNVKVSEVFIPGVGTQADPDVTDDYKDNEATGSIGIDFGSAGMAKDAAGDESFADSFAWDLPGPALKTSDDNADVTWGYAKNDDGTDNTTILIGKGADDQEVIRVEMSESGEYTVTLSQAVEHATPDGKEDFDYNTDLVDQADAATDAADVETPLEFGFTITDGDGDTAPGNIDVYVEDDVLALNNTATETPDDIVADFDYFDQAADANDLIAALDVDLSGARDDGYTGGVYDVDFYKNNSDKPYQIETGSGITITGAIVTQGSYNYETDGVALGWRVDNSDPDKDGDKDYADGLGMTSGTSNDSGSKWEVGATGDKSYEDGASVEALIITLPEGDLAYGVDLSFGCFFNAVAEGGDKADKDDEYITLEFYKGDELVHTVTQLVGEAGGDGNFDSSTVTVPFDEVRIIPSQSGSDFVLNNIDFTDYAHTIVHSEEGVIEATGADGLAGTIKFEGISVVGSGEEPQAVEAGTTLTIDGTEVTLKELGTNVFVAVAKNADGNEDAYFTLSLDGNGNWTMHQHKEFSDDLNITFGATDHDGDHASVEVTFEGMEFGINSVDDELTTDDADVDASGKDTAEGELTFTATEGVSSITIGGVEVPLNAENFTIAGVNGALVITGITQNGEDYTVNYEYVQSENFEHDAPNDSITSDEVKENADSFDVVITDGLGQNAESTINASINDDVPTPQEDYSTVTDTGTANAVVELDFGGDDGAGKTIEFNGVTFTYGEDGNWKADSTGGSVDTFGENGVTLKTDGMTLSTGGGEGNDLWAATMTDIAEGATETQNIKFTDSDGDSTDLNITATHTAEELPKHELESTAGVETHFTAGTNYNVSIILDTSGSLYHDSHGDIKGTDADGNPLTRLDLACDAIINFVSNELYPHTQNEVSGGEVNLHVTTFWGGLDVLIDGSKPLEEVVQEVYDEINALRELTKDSSDPDFHWGTNYEKGFNSAAEWFETEEISTNGYDNVVFFMTDGVPHQGNSAAGHKNLVEALENTSSTSNTIHVAGMGAGANLGNIEDFAMNGEAKIVLDNEDFDSIFKPQNGTSMVIEQTSVGTTLGGNDVLIGGVDAAALKATLSAYLGGIEVTDHMAVEFMQNDPEWLNEHAANLQNDPDVLVAGAGDDLMYGQGGNDVLIGDGNESSMGNFATELGVSGTYDLADKEDAEAFADALSEAAREADVADLMAAADKLENVNVDAEGNAVQDGNDIMYGGDGAEGTADDVLLGLGGDDSLFGGAGDDILYGGSGNDYLVGGDGKDTLLGGSGDDLIQMDMQDVLVDGGEDMDVLLVGASDLAEVVDRMEDGEITNIEVVIAGKAEGSTTDEVLQDAGAQDENGNWLVNQEGSGWSGGDEQTIGGRVFMEYTKDEGGDDAITILIAQNTPTT